MRRITIILFAVVFLLLLCQFQGIAVAHTKIIINPWWPAPLVIFPVVPPPQGPLPSPPPPPEGYNTGFVNIDVRPPDAEIFIDGEFRGLAKDFSSAPGYFELFRGEHRITLKKAGFATVSFIVRIIPGELVTLDIALEPATEDTKAQDRIYQLDTDKTGHLTFDISPPDAAIYINGNFYGIASNLKDVSGSLLLRAGKHHLEVVRPGYIAYESDIILLSNEKKRIKIRLERKE